MIKIPEVVVTNGVSAEMANRLWNREMAGADRQAVFKKDCVKCHLQPAFGKTGAPLYQAACAICHEAPHRATMVPDLHTLSKLIEADYWRTWVTHGRDGTLMPGFAATEGGPLDEAQINSLVEYLPKAFPKLKPQEPEHDD
jgi:cytochrome c553